MSDKPETTVPCPATRNLCLDEWCISNRDCFIQQDQWPTCPTCNGSGTVNPLTAPAGFFCVSTAECPTCEGSGGCP